MWGAVSIWRLVLCSGQGLGCHSGGMTSHFPFVPSESGSGPYSMRKLHDSDRHLFGSDTFAGIHPEVLEAIALANGGHVRAYGDDPYTRALQDVMKRHFGPSALTVPVFNGTGANVVALEQMTRRWESVVCARTAHVNTDECGAAERMSGIKLIPVDCVDGKLTPDAIDRVVPVARGEHTAVPTLVTISQATELGTVYSVDELRALVEYAHGMGMRVHVDGSRMANAAVALGVGLADLTVELGVDAVSLGGTNSGLVGVEALVVLDPVISQSVKFTRKFTGQLGAKMRFMSAQLLALYGGDLWVRNAVAANDAASRLAQGLGGIPGVRLVHPVEANTVFAVLPRLVNVRLRRRWGFSDWDRQAGVVRLMTSWDTSVGHVDAFLEDLTAAVAAGE
ncbi:Low specificity L-threonine aldolase [Dermatophilus congolensis]|uniref:Low specificity L-threonine aldolase n=2 Tax=Dermatophilus congolensis TaxID=1863 RepID=A0AA46BLK4_9MICO|nr:Low specificity L-threonine aldolase [Dermatophilus congolensis]